MRAVNCLLAVLFLAAASSAVAQEKHLIDPMLPGSLDPEPLPPLKNPDAPSTPAKELFARKSTLSIAKKITRIDDEMRFIRSWLERPLATGAVMPSGRPLARAIAHCVDP